LRNVSRWQTYQQSGWREEGCCELGIALKRTTAATVASLAEKNCLQQINMLAGAMMLGFCLVLLPQRW